MQSMKVTPHAPDANGVVMDINANNSNLKYVGLRVVELLPNQVFQSESGNCELCLVILNGRVDVTCGEHQFSNIGNRMDVFEQIAPYAVYLPNQVRYQIKAITEARIAVCSAPGYGHYGVRLIEPKDIKQSTRGEGANVRYVHDILPETEPADSLLVVEVYTPAGNWSSYPPHKHDQDNLPQESFLEESYYHRINPSQGFAFQRVYTDDRSIDEALVISNGECVMVPKGYHPVGTPYGYELYYLNVMAGPKRVWKFHNDPQHEWVLKKEKVNV